MAGAGVVVAFDAVAVVAGAFDRAWVGPVSPRRNDRRGDLGEDLGQGVLFPVLRGGKPAVAVRRAMRRMRVKEIRSGSRSAAWAARVASADRA